MVAERQAELLARRIESSGVEQERVEAQNHHLRMQHVHDRMRLVLDAGLAALGATLLVGIAWLFYGAVTDRSIVVNAFFVPPRLARKDYAGAITKAEAAHKNEPHWADPLEVWGEALAAQGQYSAAAGKYAEAYAYAPKWGALQLHWGEALDRLGDHSHALALPDGRSARAF